MFWSPFATKSVRMKAVLSIKSPAILRAGGGIRDAYVGIRTRARAVVAIGAAYLTGVHMSTRVPAATPRNRVIETGC